MADGSMFHSNEYLQLIQDTFQYLQENRAAPLATQDDCDYFRQKFKASSQQNKPALPPAMMIAKPPVLERESLPAPAVPAAPIVQQIFPEPIIKPEPIKPSAAKTELADSLEWPALSFSKWKAIFAKIAPTMPVLPDVPSDFIAKKIATRWKTKNLSAPITLLSYQELPEQKALLEQITLALDVYFGPAKLVSAENLEKGKEWDTFLSVDELKIIIACDYTLWQMPGLLKFYKENASRRQLGEKELFLLPDLSLYLKDPLLKRSLWKALCQICEPLSLPSSSTKI